MILLLPHRRFPPAGAAYAQERYLLVSSSGYHLCACSFAHRDLSARQKTASKSRVLSGEEFGKERSLLRLDNFDERESRPWSCLARRDQSGLLAPGFRLVTESCLNLLDIERERTTMRGKVSSRCFSFAGQVFERVLVLPSFVLFAFIILRQRSTTSCHSIYAEGHCSGVGFAFTLCTRVPK